jgi:hypothetical protein
MFRVYPWGALAGAMFAPRNRTGASRSVCSDVPSLRGRWVRVGLNGAAPRYRLINLSHKMRDFPNVSGDCNVRRVPCNVGPRICAEHGRLPRASRESGGTFPPVGEGRAAAKSAKTLGNLMIVMLRTLPRASSRAAACVRLSRPEHYSLGTPGSAGGRSFSIVSGKKKLEKLT